MSHLIRGFFCGVKYQIILFSSHIFLISYLQRSPCVLHDIIRYLICSFGVPAPAPRRIAAVPSALFQSVRTALDRTRRSVAVHHCRRARTHRRRTLHLVLLVLLFQHILLVLVVVRQQVGGGERCGGRFKRWRSVSRGRRLSGARCGKRRGEQKSMMRNIQEISADENNLQSEKSADENNLR